MGDASRDALGRYRLWDGVSLRSGVFVSRRPLAVTTLNESAVDVVSELETTAFTSPTAIAAATGYDRSAVARILDGLHQRGFLEWAPARDAAHRPPVSVVVTVRNDRANLQVCLDALATLAYDEYEVVVVDDGSTDGTAALARSHSLADAGRLEYVSVGSATDPLGIGASRNHGVEATSYDVIAFTDADCRPRETWLAELVPVLAAHDLVGGRIRPAGETPADVYEGVNSSLDMGAYAARIRRDGQTPYLPTANLVGRREVFESVPFPDRNVAEDVDVCWRALEDGYDVVYTPMGVVEHAYRTSIRSFASRRADYGSSEALLARTYGHGDAVGLPIWLVLVALSAVAAAIGGTTLLAGGVIGAAVVGYSTLAVVRTARRLRTAVETGAVVRSLLRSTLSTVYALSREVTRYYAIPVALLAVVLVPTSVGTAVALALSVVVALPAAVEYAVHRPAVSPLRYGQYYLTDHLGYQLGVYRGAIGHRTLAHLSPVARFRLRV
ncbi:mycofactocin biosynthesis glycosyltransferase MftF [Haloarchaeobius amylolyticus]|uniref:Mycofactocin biosynthesis glycosyltransferase MftF n=1 Tax=Haloarchaeobius amylolyticus TaxID=1198296 RepID=A0ABD6BHU7_9EURY